MSEPIEVVDALSHAEQSKPIPPAHMYTVQIDQKEFLIATGSPSVEQLLGLVDRQLCSHALFEIRGNSKHSVEPGDKINLHEHGSSEFITEPRELVTIVVKNMSFTVQRGEYTIDQILALIDANLTSTGYNLYEEKPGQPPMPVPEKANVDIVGCEIFSYQVKAGTSS